MPRSPTTLLVRSRQLVQVLASLARSSHEIEAVVQVVHRQTETLFPAHITLLALRQPDGNWRWEVYREEKRHTHHLPFYAEGLIEAVLCGGPLSIPDLPAYLDQHPVRIRQVVDDRVIGPGDQNSAGPGRLAVSMLFVPLEVQGERMGVLSIQSYEAGAFDDTDLEFLEFLGQHVSIALENAALREKLEHLTRTDPLTGLPNRRAFYHDVPLCLHKARQQGRELGLIMLDIHEFKQINDRLGHQAGDAVLSRVGQVLSQTFPAPDAAFRLSGDEFALLVWEPQARLEALAAHLTQALRASEWPPGSGPICLQGGVAPPPPDGNIDDWLSVADARMYHAKRRRVVDNQVDWGLDFGHVVPVPSGD